MTKPVQLQEMLLKTLYENRWLVKSFFKTQMTRSPSLPLEIIDTDVLDIDISLQPLVWDNSEVVINDCVLNLKKLMEMSEIVSDKEHAAKGKN